MKNPILRTLTWIMTLSAPLILMSCQDDDMPKEPNLETVEDDFTINAAFEDLDFVTLEVAQSSGLGLRTLNGPELCAGATINHDLNAKKITVDFGAGCTGPSGVVRKGKIMLSYSGTNFLFPGTSIVANFEGYEVNGLKIEGTRSLTNAGIDLATSTITVNVKIENAKITWPDNTFVTYATTQVRKIKLSSTGYQVSIESGTANGKSRENVNYTASVAEPLILKEECTKTGNYVPGSGILDFTYSGFAISVNYGTGTCDKLVTVSYGDTTKEITLD